MSHFGNSVFRAGQLRRRIAREKAKRGKARARIRPSREECVRKAPYLTQSQRVRWWSTRLSTQPVILGLTRFLVM